LSEVFDVGVTEEVGVKDFGLGSKEDTDDTVGLLVAENLDLVGEGLVVQPGHLGDVVDAAGFLSVSNVDSVRHINVEEVEVGDEVRDLDVLDGNAGEVEFSALVSGEVLLVLEEEVVDVLLEDVERRVPEGSLVEGDGAGGDAVAVAGVQDQGEQAAEHSVVRAIVAAVDGVLVAFNDVTEDVDALELAHDGDP